MARKLSQAETPDVAVPAEPSVSAQKQPATDGSAAGNSSTKQRRVLRLPLNKLRRVSRGVSKCKSRKYNPLANVQHDKLCLDIFNELLPQQFMAELRVQVQGGSAPFAAIQQATNQQLNKLSKKDARKLFLAAAAAASASCGAVHIMKRLACCLAKPLRLETPVGFVTRVLTPIPLYGPLLAAYVTVITAQGAIRELKADKQPTAAAATDEQQSGLAGSLQQSIESNKVREDSAAASQGDNAGAHASGSSSMPTQQQRPQQQQHKEGGKPWWAIWKRKQQIQKQQQQEEEEEVQQTSEVHPAAAAAANTTAQDTGATAAAATSSSSNVKGVSHVVLRKAAMEHQESRGSTSMATGQGNHTLDSNATAAAAASNSQQQQQGFGTPQLRHTNSPLGSPRTSNDVTDSESNDPPTPARYNSIGRKESLSAAQLNSTARDQHSSSSDATAAAGSSSPSELDSQVDKLQRRWSSGDHEVLAEEALRFSQVQAQPYRPPVFSRLASGKPACRITAAAAEQLPEQFSGGSSCSSSSGKIGVHGRNAAAAAAADGGGLVRSAVSLDLGSAAAAAAAAAGGSESPKLSTSLHKAHSDVVRLHSMGPMAAAAATAAVTDGNPQQQQQHQGKSVTKGAQSQFKQKMYKSFDWGHRLLTGEH